MTDNTSQKKLDAEAPPAEESSPESGLRAALFSGAAKVKEQAQSSLSSLTSKTDELREQAAAKVEEIKDAGTAKLEEIKDAGSAKLMETLDELNGALPILREAGFALKAIILGVLPPLVSAEFNPSEDVSPANVERLLTQHADKKLTVMLIKALYNAWQMQKKVTIAGLSADEIVVELGLIPSVSVKFT